MPIITMNVTMLGWWNGLSETQGTYIQWKSFSQKKAIKEETESYQANIFLNGAFLANYNMV